MRAGAKCCAQHLRARPPPPPRPAAAAPAAAPPPRAHARPKSFVPVRALPLPCPTALLSLLFWRGPACPQAAPRCPPAPCISFNRRHSIGSLLCLACFTPCSRPHPAPPHSPIYRRSNPRAPPPRVRRVCAHIFSEPPHARTTPPHLLWRAGGHATTPPAPAPAPRVFCLSCPSVAPPARVSNTYLLSWSPPPKRLPPQPDPPCLLFVASNPAGPPPSVRGSSPSLALSSEF